MPVTPHTGESEKAAAWEWGRGTGEMTTTPIELAAQRICTSCSAQSSGVRGGGRDGLRHPLQGGHPNWRNEEEEARRHRAQSSSLAKEGWKPRVPPAATSFQSQSPSVFTGASYAWGGEPWIQQAS